MCVDVEGLPNEYVHLHGDLQRDIMESLGVADTLQFWVMGMGRGSRDGGDGNDVPEDVASGESGAEDGRGADEPGAEWYDIGDTPPSSGASGINACTGADGGSGAGVNDGSVSLVMANGLAQRVSASLRTAEGEEAGELGGYIVWLAVPCYSRLVGSWLAMWRMDAGTMGRVTAWFRTVGVHTPDQLLDLLRGWG